jgi:predicted nucleic-acid-binding protein
MLGQSRRLVRNGLGSRKRLRYRRQEIGDAVQALLGSDELLVEEQGIVRSALYAFRISRAGFADCLLGMSNGFQGCVRTLTFDRRAAELDEFELI